MKFFLLSALICAITIQGMELSAVKQCESEIPRTLSTLKHYNIPINKSKNKFLLNLTQNDPSVSIDYLWDGKSVARYIAVDQRMFLESLNPEGYNFSIITPIKKSDLNINLYGKIRFQELVHVGRTATIKCKSLKNKNNLNAQQLCFSGQIMVNDGSINTGRSTIEKCGTIINKNNWIVEENCYLNDVEKLITSKNSSWQTGGCWGGAVKELYLDGNVSVGAAALLSVENASFKGLFDSPILKVESKERLESFPQSKFLVSYHLGLKAKDSIVWEGDIFDNSGNKLALSKDDSSQLNKSLKKGIFLQSDEGSLSKSGIIAVSDKPVFLLAKKDLHHDRLTKSKGNERGVIVLSGENVHLGKESQLEGYAAQLNAQESITYDGKTQIESCPQIHDASKDAIDSAGVFVLNAKKIKTTKESRIDAKKAFIIAQDIIDQQGVIKVKEDLSQTAAAIEMEETSSVAAKNAFIHGTEKISQSGKLTARQALIMRSKKLYNAGTIQAENSHFKADRWWLNRGTISIRDASQIDALLSMNVYPGTMHTKRLITNALGDLNLGFYKTQSADNNTILSFNAGEYLLPINFEGITRNDKIKAAEQMLLLMAPPHLQAYYHLGKFWLNLGFTFDTAGRLYREWTQLPATYRGVSDLMPLLAGSFNFAFSSFQQVISTKNLLDTIQGFYKEDNGINLPPFDSMKALQSIAVSVLPVHNFKSVANLNFGKIQGFEGSFTNIFDVNACGSSVKDALSLSEASSPRDQILFPGGLLFLNNYALNTYRGFNDGITGASTASVSAKRSYGTGENSSIGSLAASLEARDLTLKNHLYAVDALVKASGTFALYGNISTLRKINLMAPEIVLKKNSYLSALQGGIFANGKRIESAGGVSGQRVCVFGKDVVLKEGGNTQSHGLQAAVTILAEYFTTENGSKIAVTGNDDPAHPENNQIMISAKNADFQPGSSLDACKGALRVAAEEGVKHAATVNGQQVQMRAKDLVLKEGSDTRAQGQQALVVMQAEDFKAEEGSNVVSSGEGIQDKSNNKIVISAKNADLQKGSSLDACNGCLQVAAAEKITHEARAQGRQVHMKAQNILLKGGSDTQVKEQDVLAELPVVICSDGPRALLTSKVILSKSSFQGGKAIEIREGGSIEFKKEQQALAVMHADDTLKSEKGARVTVSQESVQVQDQLTSRDPDPKIILHGGKKMDLQQGSHFDPLDGSTMVTGGDATIAASMKGVVLTRTKNLSFEKGQEVDVRALRAFAEEEIVQKDNLNALNFFMRAKRVKNSGKVTTKKGIIKADQYYCNTGSMLSEDILDITAPVTINFKSHTRAKRLTNNALLDVNLLSIDETQISDNKALISLDLSLHLPLITDDMISAEGVKVAGKRVLLMVLPPHVKLVYKLLSFLSKIPGMASELNELRKDVTKVYNDPTAGASDWVTLVNRAASLVIAAKQGYSMTQEVYGEFAPTDASSPAQNDSSNNKDSSAQNKSSDKTDEKTPLINYTSKGVVINLKTFENVMEAGRVVSSIGGALINQHHNRQSLVDLNYGAAVGFNGSSVNLCDANVAKLYANYHLDTCYGQNLGILAGGNVSVSAHKYQNGISSSVGGRQIESSACIAGLNLAIKADSFKGSACSSIASTNGTSLETKELDNKGVTHGSLSLKFIGQPEQLKSIGTVKPHGGSFSYQGPVAERGGAGVPSADELAHGSGAWGSVSGATEIRFDAGAQDIHIKKLHNMPHALQAKTAGSIAVDQPLKSEHSIGLHAGQDLTHNSLIAKEHIQRIAQKGSITARSTVERAQDGANYEDRVNQCSVIARKSNTTYAGKDIIQTAVETKSGKEGVVLVAKGDIVDDHLICEKHIEQRGVSGSTKDTYASPHVSTYSSDGKLIIHAGGVYRANAAVYNAMDNEKSIGGLKGTVINDVKEVHVHETTKKKEGWWSSEATQEKTVSSRSMGAKFVGHGTPFVVGSDAQETILVNPQSDVPLVFKGESAKVLLGENRTVSVKKSAYANVLYESEESKPTEELTYAYAQVPGIENHTKSFLIQLVKGKTCAFLDKINNINEGQVSAEFLDEYRHADTSSSRRLTNNARIVLGLSIGLLTQGVGTSIAAGLTSIGMGSSISTVLSHMTTGSINQLLNKAANILVEANGDIHRAVERMASYQTLQEAAFAALSAGAISCTDQTMNALRVPYAQEGGNFLERVAYAAPREFIHKGVQTGISSLAGQPINQILPEQLKDFVAKTLHNVLVGEIAGLYANDDINSLAHKVLHGVAAGTIYGGVYGSMNTALAAGLGAFSAEIAAELMAPSKDLMHVIMKADSYGYNLTQEQFITSYADAMRDYMRRTHTAQQVGQLTAAITGIAMGQDAAIAHQAALTALDNNFLVLAMYGLTAASVAYSGYQLYKSYQEGGVDAALKQLGIEVAYNAAGHVAGKGIAYFGGKVYPCVEQAARAALDEAPALKLILGDLAEKIIVGAQKLNASPVGKCVAKIETALVEQEAKILSKIGFNRVPAAAGLAQEEFEAAEEMVLAGTGITVKVEREAQREIAAFNKANEASRKQTGQAITSNNAAVSKPMREQILPKMKTYDEARNKALEIIGNVDPHSAVPHIGELHACKDKICGLRWEKNKVVMRLDYDPIKGPHINVADFRRPSSMNKFAIPFEGNEQTIRMLLKHLNTKSSLEQARMLYKQIGNEKDLIRITNIMETLNKK